MKRSGHAFKSKDQHKKTKKIKYENLQSEIQNGQAIQKQIIENDTNSDSEIQNVKQSKQIIIPDIDQNQNLKVKTINENNEITVKTANDLDDKRKLYVVLVKAPLQTAKMPKTKQIELLNSDDHRSYIQHKLKQNFALYRPDIAHQCLLTLLDSPLNKAGLLEVFIQTEQNVLIKINPKTKIPRTFKRFSALMAQLLTKLKIRSEQTSENLLKVIKNPVTNYLPSECRKIGTSTKARVVNLKEFVNTLPKNEPIVYVVGAVASGNPAMECDFIDDSICISQYGLSASCCLSKIVNTYEELWNIQ